MARKKSPEQLDREIAAALAATSGAPFGDPRRLRAVSRSVQHGKRKEIEAHFPIGALMKVVAGSPEFVGKIGSVTGYDLGMDEDAALVKVRYGTITKIGSQRVREGKYEDNEIVRVPRAEGRVSHAAKKDESIYVGNVLRDALVEDISALDWEDRQPQADKIKAALQNAAPHRDGFLFDTEGWSLDDIDFLRETLSSVEESEGHGAMSRGMGFGNTRIGRQIRALREKL